MLSSLYAERKFSYMIYFPSDLIITQMFFDVAVFHTFVSDCRKIGINCPIVPGLMCINNYAGFIKMTKFCKTRVTPDLREKMEELKDDAAAVKQFGIDFGTKQCQDLMTGGAEKPLVLHFYTLNLEKVVYGILDNLGLSNNASAGANEADAASQVATGSAWARVGDTVKITADQRQGVVQKLDEKTGEAVIQISEGGDVVTVAKGKYSKLF